MTDPIQKGYVATIIHTMGSALYTFTKLTDGNIEILVTNTTSVGSATGANANVTILGQNILGLNGSYSRQNTVSEPQPWTNVQQTIRIVKSVTELKKL